MLPDLEDFDGFVLLYVQKGVPFSTKQLSNVLTTSLGQEILIIGAKE